MDFGTVLHVFYTAVVLLLMMSILVAAHELGHYLFARLFKMGVEEFAIGFGRKPLWTYMRRTYEVDPISGPSGETKTDSDQFTEEERFRYPTDGSAALQPEPVVTPSPSQVKLSLQETTDFTIRPWPIGGFVRIKGMIPQDDGSETKIPGGFYSKAPWKRFIVLLAGPVFSVITGIIILTGVFSIRGVEKPDTRPILGQLSPNGAAQKGGLKEGDKILAINDKPVDSFYGMVQVVSDNANKPLTFKYVRGGKEAQAVVTPVEELRPVMGPDLITLQPARKAGRIGVGFGVAEQKMSLGEAFQEAAYTPVMIIKRLIELIPRPQELKENVGGPISIAQATSTAVKLGPGYIILLSGLLSISVGIFNLLPIPPLDGGQMLVAVLEALRRGKRLSIQVQGAIATVGFAFVIFFFVTVMFIDVGRLLGPKPKVEIQKQEATPAPAK